MHCRFGIGFVLCWLLAGNDPQSVYSDAGGCSPLAVMYCDTVGPHGNDVLTYEQQVRTAAGLLVKI